MKRMIDAYNLAHGVSQADEKPKSAWDPHRQHIRSKLAKKASMLRRLGCHPYGLDGTAARLVTRTMCDGISSSNSEMWQLALHEPTGEG